MSATGRLGHYGVWQLRDYMLGAGGATLAVGALVVLMGRGANLMVQGQSQPVSTTLIGAVCFLGPIFAASGLVAEDRVRGYYRFLFAKPVSPVLFYAQAFALRGVAFLAIVGVLAATSGLLFSVGGCVCYAALCYVGIGGIALVFSTAWRHAWLATLACAVAANIASGLAQSPAGWRPLWVTLHYVLPPFQVTSRLASSLVSGDGLPYPFGLTAWFVGYGLAAIAAALIVIRRQEWPV
jgi:ABC-type transport system involved in multi-copper enzyme maturation permease subunit